MKFKAAKARPVRKTRKDRLPAEAKGAQPAFRRLYEPKSVYLTALALAAVVLICYANSLANGFVFDDHGHALQAKLLRDLANLPRILTDSYRPLRDLSYAVDFALWGERAFGFHLTNILIHAANTVLVFLLLRRFTGETLSGALGALVFAVHPIQPDSVAYISGRRDILFAFFYLASFQSYLAYHRSKGFDEGQPQSRRRAVVYLVLFLVFWVLSLMTKEMAASLPVFIVVWSLCDGWIEGPGRWISRFWVGLRNALRKDRWLYITLALAVAAYGWYAIVLKGGSTRARLSGFKYWGGDFYTNALTAICVHAWYLKQLVFPTPIVQYSDAFDVATSAAEWRVVISLAVVGAVIATGFLMLDRNRLAAFAILSYFALLLPVSQIIPHHELLADHYLYLPMMSFGLFVSLIVKAVIAKWGQAKRYAYGATAAVLILLAIMTILRNRVYKDDMTLWQTNYEEAPNSIRAVSSLAGMNAKSYPARAAALYKRCIELDPSYAPAYLGLAFIYQTRPGAQEVEELVEKGLALPDSRITTPGYENPRRFRSELTTALALAKGFQKEPEAAEQLLREAINLYPLNAQPYSLLVGYYRGKDRSKEIEVLKQQLAIDPTNYDALTTLSHRFIEDKKYDEATPYLNAILTMLPKDFRANYQFAQIYRTKKECALSKAYLTTAASVASGDEETKAIKDALSQFARDCG
jgi:protein O-mannosyl-transferase